MQITPADIFKASSRTGNLPRWILQSDRQDQFIGKDRAAIAIVMRDKLGLSWQKIAAEFNRDHSSILRLVDKWREDEDVQRLIKKLCKFLGLK